MIASTGVIGRRYPIEKIRAGLLGLGENLEQLRQIMSKDQVNIHVSLNIGDGEASRREASATVWGCDLSEGYIEINGKYST